MKLELAKKIVDAMQDMGVEAELREEYSGRGMFGKTTAGIVTHASHGPIIGFAAARVVGSDNAGYADEAMCAINDFSIYELPSKSDTMGRDMIFY